MGCSGSKDGGAAGALQPTSAPRPAGRGRRAAAAAAAAAPRSPGGLQRSRSLLEHPKHTFAESYELFEELGKGQYASVHRIKSRPGVAGVEAFTGAAKVIDKRKLTPEDLAALNVEVKAMDLLKEHPNFVKCHDFFSEPNFFYLTMELLTGGELFDRICDKERYGEREAREVMFLMTNAMAYAHSKGIVHRDLKPENILMKSKTDDTSIKIADLGFARILQNPHELMKTACGTPGYVAPEVVSSRPYGPACDAWSLGVILYILLSGTPPFADENAQVVFQMIQAGRYDMDPAQWAHISEPAKDLVRKILVVDPAKRLSCAQILQHPWMRMDINSLPDVSLVDALNRIKRLQARRRLKKVMQLVRSVVRTRMLLGARRAIEAKKAGKDADAIEAAFFDAAQNARPAERSEPIRKGLQRAPSMRVALAAAAGAAAAASAAAAAGAGAGAQPQTNPISLAIPGKPRAKRFAVGGVEEVRAAERIR